MQNRVAVKGGRKKKFDREGFSYFLFILPVLALMAPKSFRLLKDYEYQKHLGLDPVFIPEDIGFDNCELWDEIVEEKYSDLKAAKKAAESKTGVTEAEAIK